jgi:hypothetical protein
MFVVMLCGRNASRSQISRHMPSYLLWPSHSLSLSFLMSNVHAKGWVCQEDVFCGAVYHWKCVRCVVTEPVKQSINLQLGRETIIAIVYSSV